MILDLLSYFVNYFLPFINNFLSFIDMICPIVEVVYDVIAPYLILGFKLVRLFLPTVVWKTILPAVIRAEIIMWGLSLFLTIFRFIKTYIPLL